MPLNLKKICASVCELSIETSSFILAQRKKLISSQVETKSKNSFVTYVDKESEKRLVKGLQRILPEAGFITEEETISSEKKKYTWIIDPLDGTTNFIHGLPSYCISIALYEQDPKTKTLHPLVGVIYEPNLKELFYATKNGGAYLNKKRISVSGTKKLKDSLLATGFPTYDYSKMDEYIKLFRHLMFETRGLRRLGSAAVDLAYTACGRFDAFYEYSLSPWDVAAGALIVKEAGGKISDFNGKENWLFGKEIIASNHAIHAPLLSAVKKSFSASSKLKRR